MNGEQLINDFIKIYGREQGQRIYMNVMPGILADFSKMLAKAGPGREVSEEYILEDKKAALSLCGRAVRNGLPEIEAKVKSLI